MIERLRGVLARATLSCRLALPRARPESRPLGSTRRAAPSRRGRAPGFPLALVALLALGAATAEEIAALTARMGLDRPLPEQYLRWLGDLLRGDLGTSIFFGEPVLSVIADGATTSLLLATLTMFWIVVIGVPIGVVAATRHGGWIDATSSGLAMFAASVPTFWLGPT